MSSERKPDRAASAAARSALPPPFDLVLFHGTGDLAMRKLLPALYRRYADGQLSPQGRITPWRARR